MLTTEQILALSPDDASAKAARGLLAPGKWPTLGHDEAAIWGECQGSGSKPYQVIIDVSGPTFKCSCPSRKFPCKHGLALYLLLAQKAGAFTAGGPPAWVAEWLGARRERAEKQAEKKAPAAEVKPPDPEAAAKREAKRLDRILAGARDLERWMTDLIRQGLADLPGKSFDFWREAAARMVDAQAPGLAAAVRQLEECAAVAQDGWQRRTLAQMGKMQLAIEALARLDDLPEPLRHDARGAAGWAMDKEEVTRLGEKVEDRWLVQGVSHDENDNLHERRVWLFGLTTNRQAMLLDFSHGTRRFEHAFIAGSTVKAGLVFFPGATPLRAILTYPPVEEKCDVSIATVATWDLALEGVADSVAGQPWPLRLPVMLGHAIPARRGPFWRMRDANTREAAAKIGEDDGWQLLALSGGHPLRIFGEWLGDQWRPLTAWSAGAAAPCWTESISLSR